MEKKLHEVCKFYTGTGFPTKYQGNAGGDLPFYKVGDIAANVNSGNIYLSFCNNYISKNEAREIKGNIIPSDTIVFAKIGEALRMNKRAITTQNCLVDNNAMGIMPISDVLDTKYFYYFMCNLKLETLAEATTVPSVRKSRLENVVIKILSMDEQKRIVRLLDQINGIISDCKKILSDCDTLIKSKVA